MPQAGEGTVTSAGSGPGGCGQLSVERGQLGEMGRTGKSFPQEQCEWTHAVE